MSHYRDRVIADLEHLTAHAEKAKVEVDGQYLQGYLDAMRHALDTVRAAGDTPAETPTARMLAERADDRRTT